MNGLGGYLFDCLDQKYPDQKLDDDNQLVTQRQPGLGKNKDQQINYEENLLYRINGICRLRV